MFSLCADVLQLDAKTECLEILEMRVFLQLNRLGVSGTVRLSTALPNISIDAC